jgi:hypothetical protein
MKATTRNPHPAPAAAGKVASMLLVFAWCGTAAAQAPRSSEDSPVASRPGATTAADCEPWKTLPALDRQNMGDDVVLKWKDYLRRDARAEQVDVALRCLGLRLGTLENALRLQTTTVRDGKYLGRVETELEGIQQLLSGIAQTLNRPQRPQATTTSDPALNSDLRAMIGQQLKLSQSLLDKLGTLGKQPSWIVLQGGTGGARAGEPTTPGNVALPQLEATANIAQLFPTARLIQYAIVTVADPRVPRHRRLYDNAITAISQGMLINGFVLDRYEFPWQSDLKQPGTGFLAELDSVSNDKRFGLMVFRRDNWRYDEKSNDLRSHASPGRRNSAIAAEDLRLRSDFLGLDRFDPACRCRHAHRADLRIRDRANQRQRRRPAGRAARTRLPGDHGRQKTHRAG